MSVQSKSSEQISTIVQEIKSKVQYHTCKLSDLVIEHSSPTEKETSDKKFISSLVLSDKSGAIEPTSVGERFLTTLGRKTGITKEFLRAMPPQEVIDRVLKIDGDRELVIAKDDNTVLGVSRRNDLIISAEQSLDAIRPFSPIDISYANGVINATLPIQKGGSGLKILGEDHEKRVTLTVPVDGGSPNLIVSLLRLICTNGMMAMTPTFTSPIKVGKDDGGFTIRKAIEIFSGDQQFTQLASRMEESQRAYASASEVRLFLEVLKNGPLHTMVSKTLNDLGISSRDLGLLVSPALTSGAKRLRRVETAISRYDLINLVTETRTHMLGDHSIALGRPLDAFIGDLLGTEPDLAESIPQTMNKKPVELFFKRAA